MKSYLAIDIGASSGRHILGSIHNGKLRLEEIYRFSNAASQKNGHLCWDLDNLCQQVLSGLKAAASAAPVSVGVDTWGVDYVLLDENDRLLGDAIAYRDERTNGMEQKVDLETLYRHTGIASQPFNTLYQLMAASKEQLLQAKTFLMMPDYLHYILCGVKANEYTNASTTALLNGCARQWDLEVLKGAGIPDSLFSAPLRMPGTVLGPFTQEVRNLVGFDATVVLPATHDTGSAYMAVPALDDGAVYLSSGTWSLLGVETTVLHADAQSQEAGFTNEGGYGNTYRFLKNIMGLWIVQSVRKEQENRHSFAEMAELAKEEASFPSRFDANAPRFLAPGSMIQEILMALRETNQPLPERDGQLYACVLHSLADCYAAAIRQLSGLTGKRYTTLNIVGGGSQNAVLNQWTADATGLPVYAGPTEGTALGNLIAQMIASGELSDLPTARKLIRDSFPIQLYQPMKGTGD
ncbi:MAG: rhamnulokinase [Eubacteriales bacterium]|nr:rhamnulokinase [Eubacteriales bacterium]